MLIVKHRPWTEIADFYCSLAAKNPAFQAMQMLVSKSVNSLTVSNCIVYRAFFEHGTLAFNSWRTTETKLRTAGSEAEEP